MTVQLWSDYARAEWARRAADPLTVDDSYQVRVAVTGTLRAEAPSDVAAERVDLLEGAELAAYGWIVVTSLVAAALVAVLALLGIRTVVRRG